MTTRDERNLNPHADALVAMLIWGEEYADQRGGCMDFYDTLTPNRKDYCAHVVNSIVDAASSKPRALQGEKQQ